MLKSLTLATLSGILLSLAWPTYGFSPIIFIAFVPLFILEHQLRVNNRKGPIFLYSLVSFVIWNSCTTWWIWNATVFGAIFAIIVNSSLMSSVFFIYHLIAKKRPLRYSIIAFSGLWLGFEKFHHHWDFSWPWLTLGNVFSNNIEWVQWYEYTGVFGGSLWVLLVNAVFFLGLVEFLHNPNHKAFTKQIILAFAIIVMGIFISKYIYIKYQNKGIVIEAIALQPNTDPYTEKYNTSHQSIAKNLIELSLPKIDNNTQLILAPETVFSTKVTERQFEHNPPYQLLRYFLNKYPKTHLLMGLDSYKMFDDKTKKSKTAITLKEKKKWFESYNTAFFMNAKQKTDYYHKSKLVVGVEHFPFRSILKPLLGDLMINLGGSTATLTPNKSPKTFKLKNLDTKIAPIICYESIYGEHISQCVQKGANVLGIITNDSWWGDTQGYKQLLSYTKLRAIEQRRSIIRSANSGISAFIDQKGNILNQLKYNTKGALKGKVLANNIMTVYAQHGDYIARLGSFVGIFFTLIAFFVPKPEN